MPKLYLLVGYPGAGKTTVSKLVSQLTGAVHIWADGERQAMFGEPSHHEAESRELYNYLNTKTADYLKQGRSVVFDTSFNHYADRQALRHIAQQYQAETVVLWVTTTAAEARRRATHSTHALDNRYSQPMSNEVFDRIASHLEVPRPDEQAIELDGQAMDEAYIRQKLGL